MAMKFVEQFRLMLPLMDEPGDSGGGGADKPAGAGNDGAKPDAKPNDQQRPDPGIKAGTPLDKNGDDARYKGMLADLQRERKARQDAEARYTSAAAEAKSERARVLALAGITPKSQDETDNAEILERLYKVAPWLRKLGDENVIDKLLGSADNAEELQKANVAQWANHSRQMLASVKSEVEKAFGGELTERQELRLKRAYIQEATDNPEFLARHDAGDQSLIKEFVKEFVDDWLEPARRQVTKTEAERFRKVPSGRDRSVAGPGGKKINYNDPKAVEDALVASFKEHGGAFGE